MKTFKNFVNKISPISDKSWERFKPILHTKKVPAGSILCKYNTYPKFVYYSKQGYGRAYSIDRFGKEFNIVLYPPNRFMASMSALARNTKSNLEIQCLTDCELIYFSYKELMELVEHHDDFCKFYRKALEYYLIKLEKSNIRYVTSSATERYMLLKAESPKIESHIAQYHIASHLGITPIQLSRIRKKVNILRNK